MDEAAKQARNTLNGIVDQLEQLNEDEQEVVLSGIDPEHRKIIENIRQERQMLSFIGDTLGSETIQFGADDEDGHYQVNTDTGEYS